MMTIEEYFRLTNDKEVTRNWLKNYDPNNKPTFHTVMFGGNYNVFLYKNYFLSKTSYIK